MNPDDSESSVKDYVKKEYVKTSSVKKESIYDFIDIEGLRRYLLNQPHLLIIFEFLVIHVNNHLQI
mgnify:CR=1 FL=1|jgi:hypothetical protein